MIFWYDLPFDLTEPLLQAANLKNWYLQQLQQICRIFCNLQQMVQLSHFSSYLLQILSGSVVKESEQYQGGCFAAKLEVAAKMQHFFAAEFLHL